MDYAKLKISELKDLCKQRNLEYKNNFNKAEYIKLILGSETNSSEQSTSDKDLSNMTVKQLK
jgi:hypothetical protein